MTGPFGGGDVGQFGVGELVEQRLHQRIGAGGIAAGGDSVMFGDGTKKEVLTAAGLSRAAAVVR